MALSGVAVLRVCRAGNTLGLASPEPVRGVRSIRPIPGPDLDALKGPMPLRRLPLVPLVLLLACGREEPRPLAGHASLGDSTVDPYHFPPFDTLPQTAYDGWKQYQLACARCHGEDARGTSFGPDLVEALRTDSRIPDLPAFAMVLAAGRPDRGMPPAVTLGVGAEYFGMIYEYLKGRSENRYLGGRPALRPPP